MDRDPQENVVDPVERVSPSSGDSDSGESGQQRARIEAEEKERLVREEQDLDKRKDQNHGVN
jgi:hypothetical protein